MKQRQYSIEWLRVWAMFFITYGHLVGYASNIATLSDTSKMVNQYLLPLGVGAVDCFILITGYFSIKNETFFVKIINIYFEVVYYGALSLFLAVLFLGVRPQIDIMAKIFLPLAPSKFNYWFVTKYLGLVLLSPFLNHLYDSLAKKSKLTLVAVLCFLNLSLFSSGLFPWGSQYGGSWSLMWFICLYIIGRTIKEFNVAFTKIPPYISFSVWIALYVLYVLNAKFGILTWADLGYNSIFTLTTALCLFQLALTNNHIPPLFIKALSPAIFAVYIIHSNYFVKCMIEEKIFNLINKHVGDVNDIYIILLTVIFFVIAVILNYTKRFLFEIIKADKVIIKYGQKISMFLFPRK